jgi:hypothetical protein
MKTLGLVFVMLGCAAWPVRATCAGQSVEAAQQMPNRSAMDTVGNHSRESEHVARADAATRAAQPSDEQQAHRKVPGGKPPASKPHVSKSSSRNELANGRGRSGSEDSKNAHHPGSEKSRNAAQNELARNETVNRAPSNRAPTAARGAAPSVSTAHHRGPNPAVIGGAGISNSRNTVALDGTHMNRKHVGN